MEVPIKMEHLKICKRDPGEAFEKYVLRFRMLVSKMKETPDLNEVLTICSMNAGQAAYFLSSAPCSTFDDLFNMVLIYEELERNKASFKASRAHANAVYDNYKGKDNQGHRNGSPPKEHNGARHDAPKRELKPWRDLKDYTYDIDDTERWYDSLVNVGHIQPLQPRNPLQPGDEDKPNFCR